MSCHATDSRDAPARPHGQLRAWRSSLGGFMRHRRAGRCPMPAGLLTSTAGHLPLAPCGGNRQVPVCGSAVAAPPTGLRAARPHPAAAWVAKAAPVAGRVWARGRASAAATTTARPSSTQSVRCAHVWFASARHCRGLLPLSGRLRRPPVAGPRRSRCPAVGQSAAQPGPQPRGGGGRCHSGHVPGVARLRIFSCYSVFVRGTPPGCNLRQRPFSAPASCHGKSWGHPA